MPKPTKRARQVIGISMFVFATLGAPQAFAAAQFRASPLHVTLRAGEQVATLSVVNAGSAPVTVRAEIAGWAQVEGKDVYSPTDDVAVWPPVLTIPAGAQQSLRVRRTEHGWIPRRELAYRLVLSEVQEKARRRPTLRQVTATVLVSPRGRVAPQLVATAQIGQARALVLHLAGGYPVLAGARRTVVLAEALRRAEPGPVQISIEAGSRVTNDLVHVAPENGVAAEPRQFAQVAVQRALLRRAAAGTVAGVLRLGTWVRLAGAPHDAEGRAWLPVETEHGDVGWVAQELLKFADTPPPG